MSGLSNISWVRSLKASDASPVSSRSAVRSDIPLIQKIEHACFSRHDRFKDYQLRRFISNPSGSVIADIILFKDKPAGWACFFTRKGSCLVRLYSICILPEYRGKGLAGNYLKKKMSAFREYGRIALEVRASNKKAVALYAKIGFTVSKELPSYYPDGETALRMERELK